MEKKGRWGRKERLVGNAGKRSLFVLENERKGRKEEREKRK